MSNCGDDDLVSVHTDSLDQSENSSNPCISRMCVMIAVDNGCKFVFLTDGPSSEQTIVSTVIVNSSGSSPAPTSLVLSIDCESLKDNQSSVSFGPETSM